MFKNTRSINVSCIIILWREECFKMSLNKKNVSKCDGSIIHACFACKYINGTTLTVTSHIWLSKLENNTQPLPYIEPDLKKKPYHGQPWLPSMERKFQTTT